MDTELFELCKEVYRLKPEWGVSGSVHQSFDAQDNNLIADGWVTGFVPLYTSDYLLEKLSELGRVTYLSQGKNWIDGKLIGPWATAQYGNSIEAGDKGDTPLKALLKLTIALYEAGELK